MDAGTVSPLLAILLLAAVGCVDGDGMVQSFNVSKPLLNQGDTIELSCKATLQATDDGHYHSLLMHLKKSFVGASTSWRLATNEEIKEGFNPNNRFHADVDRVNNTQTVKFTISNAMVKDSGIYICKTNKNHKNVTVNVISEPISAVLSLDSFPVGKTFVGINPPGFNLTGQELDVDLNRTYAVNCVVRGGHPKPNVTLATVDNKNGQLVVQYDAVAVVVETERDADNWLSEPDIKVNASMQWKPNVDVLARQLVCRAGFEKPRAIEANFVPVVDTDRLLYYCPDKIQLQKGVNDLKVSCRIVTFRGALTQLGVRTIAMSGKNYTINAELSEQVGHTSEKTLQEDRRFVLSVVRGQHAYNVTLTIKTARAVENLNSMTVEFMAENQHDLFLHTVHIETDVPGPSSGVTVSAGLATILFTLVLGAFCRP